ncbi:MAG: T9SS type A sorting domain-containing protein, partial [Ignavibacteriaceae bacterium]
NGNPIFTEVHPDNSVALEMFFPEGEFSYRSFKFPWGNQTSPEKVTIQDILPGNTYEFNNDSDSTGVTVTFNQLDANIYAYATVTKYNYAPVNPDFSGIAPLLISSYFKMEGQLINSFNGEIQVDLNKYPGITSPKKTMLYVRPEFSQIFIPLPTSYNSSRNQLVCTTTDFGDFAFGIPQNISAYPPFPISPKDNEIVNGETEVNLMWGIPGIFKSFHLQIATDSLFNNLVIDNTGLKSTLLTINSLNNNAKYFWRLNSTNSAGISEWSNVFKFYTESPYIKIVYPNGGENIFADSSYIIRWESNVNDTLDIDLIKGMDLVSVIADSITSKTNAITWHVPLSIQFDSSYKIRVTSLNHLNLFDESDNSFSINGVAGIPELKNNVKEYKLYQNFPNPFNPSTVIRYTLAKDGFVKLKIYDLLGREIATLVQDWEKAGIHSVTFKPNKLSSGVYIYSLHTGNFFRSKKLILLR